MRNHVLLWAALTVSLLVAFAAHSPAAAEDDPPGLRVAELQDQLESGLKARLPNEFAFIDTVVQHVRDKELSAGEVRSVFQWARRKNKNVPFPYFERAMRIIASKKGVSL